MHHIERFGGCFSLKGFLYESHIPHLDCPITWTLLVCAEIFSHGALSVELAEGEGLTNRWSQRANEPFSNTAATMFGWKGSNCTSRVASAREDRMDETIPGRRRTHVEDFDGAFWAGSGEDVASGGVPGDFVDRSGRFVDVSPLLCSTIRLDG